MYLSLGENKGEERKTTANIKILIGYHKPAILIKNDILTPIHLGRAIAKEPSKDGNIDQDDLQWMLDNMIGDDTGDNISTLNRKFCEMTGIYWAWKNYEKLGNPDYIGFMHYRRHFIFNQDILADKIIDPCNLVRVYLGDNDNYLKNMMYDYDKISEYLLQKSCITSYNFNKYSPIEYMMQNDFIPNKNLHIALNELEKDDFINKKYIQQYIKENIHYWSNMFIVPKNIFFVYCDWIFRLAFNIQTKIELINPSIAEKRIIAYIIENLLSGVFWTYLKKHKKYEIVSKEILFIENADLKKEIFPAFNSNNIAIVFCVDKNYMKYVAVTIQSILSNTTLNNNYDILILGNGLSIYNKKQCLEMIKNYHNVSLRFYDIDIYLKEYKIDEYTTFGWYTNAIFYRYLIPIILKNYEKVLYLDSDLIVLEDISIIYNTDLNNNMIGAVRDIELQRWVKNNLYDNRCLLLECDKDKYFSSGVLLMNITKMRREGITEKLLKKHKILLTKSKLHLADQDIFNAVCYNDVTFIGTEWNMQWVVNNRVRDYFKELGEKDFYNYKSAFSKPKIIHYCDFEKPWTHPHLELSAYFWHYARQTPFYEEIIYKNTNIINNIQNNIQNNNNNNNDFSVILKPIYIFSYIYYYFKYYRCKILREITFGKKKKHYKEKCKILKENINSIKKLK